MSDILKSLEKARQMIEKISPVGDEFWVGNMVLAEAHVFRFIPHVTDLPNAPTYFRHHWGINVIESDKVPLMEIWLVRDGKPYAKHSFSQLDPKPKRLFGEPIPYDEIAKMKDDL